MNNAYSPTAKALHWIVALLILVQLAVTLWMPDIGEDAKPLPVIELHFSIGLLVLLLMVVRLRVRLREFVEPVADPARPRQRLLLLAMHRLFYLLLLVAPWLGWIAASAHRLPVVWFGLVTLPALAPGGAEWGHTLGDVHAWCMWTLFVLVGLHVAAALFHHLVTHDDTLRRMLPGRRR